MAAISTWSKTAASNNAAPPNGWPEGQRPSTVNDCAREMMAAIRTQWEGTEWFDFGYTPTRTGATTFTMAGDYTSVFVAKRPIRCNDAATLYGKVVSAVYGAPNTTVTVSLDSGSLTASLSAVALHALMPVASGGIVVDEDDMTSNADFKVPTQQSVRAYVGTYVGDYVSANAVSSGLYLTSDRTYYVDKATGNDANSGLSAGAAFATIQKGVDTVSALIINNKSATINVADGTYSESVTLKSPIGVGTVNLTGNTGTPANCMIANSSFCLGVFENSASKFAISGFKLASTASSCISVVANGSNITIGNIDFGEAAVGSHISIQRGAVITSANYSITGSANTHLTISDLGYFGISGAHVVTLTGTPAFGGQFISVSRTGRFKKVSTGSYSGAATGKRYTGVSNAVIDTGGGGASYFPGDSAGTTATGAQYL